MKQTHQIDQKSLDLQLLTECKNKIFDIEKIKNLIKAGADVNVKDGENITPLHWAVYMANLDVIIALITEGADVSARDKNGHTPLDLFSNKKKKEELQELLNQALLKECEKEAKDLNIKGIRNLIKAGADVNATDQEGKKPLESLSKDKQEELKSSLNKELLKECQKEPKDLNINGIRNLIKAGADVNATNVSNKTTSPLRYLLSSKEGLNIALECAFDSTIDKIKEGEVGLNSEELKGKIRRPATYLLSEENKTKLKTRLNEELLKECQKKGKDLNINGITNLIKAGADVNATDQEGKKPLESLSKDKQEELKSSLNKVLSEASKGADVGYVIEIRNLIRGGADFNVKDENDKTALDNLRDINKATTNYEIKKLINIIEKHNSIGYIVKFVFRNVGKTIQLAISKLGQSLFSKPKAEEDAVQPKENPKAEEDAVHQKENPKSTDRNHFASANTRIAERLEEGVFTNKVEREKARRNNGKEQNSK